MWIRPVIAFLKAPLTRKDIFKWLLVSAVLVGLFQASYSIAHYRYWISQLSFTLTLRTESSILSDEVMYESSQLYIPKIGVRAPLVYIDTTRESSIQEALADGIVHYAGTAKPGEFGNAYFIGHSSDLPWKSGSYKTVFALLPYLRIGDQLVITTERAEPLTYRVVETKVVRPTDLSVLDQFRRERRLISLQTSYPVGTALRRFIVVAELVEE